MTQARLIILGVLVTVHAGCHRMLPLGGPGGPDPADSRLRDLPLLPRRERPPDLPACSEGCACLFRSCRDLKERCPGAASGLHKLLIGGRTVEVYCDMESYEGGWLLVARSAEVPVDAGYSSDAFGWWVQRGAVDDDTRPYSLGAGDALSFTEMLIGERGEGNTWGDHVYGFRVPADFVAAYAYLAYDLNPSFTWKHGDCVPDVRSVWMLHYAGFTKRGDSFFLRDHAVSEPWGLRHEGFNLAAMSGDSECDRWGHLTERQGMIFVR